MRYNEHSAIVILMALRMYKGGDLTMAECKRYALQFVNRRSAL